MKFLRLLGLILLGQSCGNGLSNSKLLDNYDRAHQYVYRGNDPNHFDLINGVGHFEGSVHVTEGAQIPEVTVYNRPLSISTNRGYLTPWIELQTLKDSNVAATVEIELIANGEVKQARRHRIGQYLNPAPSHSAIERIDLAGMTITEPWADVHLRIRRP